MINVTRTRHINAPPNVVFAALSDPDQLAQLLPRVNRLEFIERSPDHARIATHMAFGPFGDIRTEGDVSWRDGEEVLYQTRKPMSVSARWTLTPAEGGTDLQATLSLDLAPILGPLAAFVPPDAVTNMIAPDLDAALNEVERRVQSQSLLERTV